MAKRISRTIRSSEKMIMLINSVRAKYIMAGKTPPTIRKITEIIAKGTNEKELLKNVKNIFIGL